MDELKRERGRSLRSLVDTLRKRQHTPVEAEQAFAVVHSWAESGSPELLAHALQASRRSVKEMVQVSDDLGRAGDLGCAERLLDLIDRLEPEMEGIHRARLHARWGPDPEAVSDLRSISLDAGRKPMARLAALSALASLAATRPLVDAATLLIRDAVEAGDLSGASRIVTLLSETLGGPPRKRRYSPYDPDDAPWRTDPEPFDPAAYG